MAAALARNLAYVDAPLGIMGRTHQSFGSNTALCNPGKKRIQEAISDYGSTFEFAPLRTMAFPNLMWDGIVGAKLTAPELFAGYELDEPQYLRATASRLKFMHSLGVDVGDDMTELLEYAKRHPELSVELSRQEPAAPFSFVRRARQILGDMGARKVTARLHAFRQLQRLRRGRSKALGTMSGDMLGFNDILGCARFLTPFVSHEIVNGARRAS
jgi:hypothetical protein